MYLLITVQTFIYRQVSGYMYLNYKFLSHTPPLNTISLRANRGRGPRSQIGENAILHQLCRIPLMSALGLEIPENPSIRLGLIARQLRAQIILHVCFEVVAPRRDIRFALAGTDVRGAGIRAVVAGADAVAVECICAIGHGGGEFAYDDPFVGAGVGARVAADIFNVFSCGHGDEGVAEDLVFVVVDDDWGC